ncbi:hypothetical protein V5O48_014705, partial [Marasmius crinis-equi]
MSDRNSVWDSVWDGFDQEMDIQGEYRAGDAWSEVELDDITAEEFPSSEPDEISWNNHSPVKPRTIRKRQATGQMGPEQRRQRQSDVVVNPNTMIEVDQDFDGVGGDLGDIGYAGLQGEGDRLRTPDLNPEFLVEPGSERIERVDEAVLDDYISEFQEGRVGFIPIGTNLYVVQGWSKEKREPMDKWFHFQGSKRGETVLLTCLCPEGNVNGACVHTECYQEFREQRFLHFEQLSFDDDKVVCFRRERTSDWGTEGDPKWLNRFSVIRGYDMEQGVRARAIVTYEGTDTGAGVWRCSKDGGSSACTHKLAARRFFHKEMLEQEEWQENWADEGHLDDENDEEYGAMMVDDASGNGFSESAISFLPIMPPIWAALPQDTPHYERHSPNREVPNPITLGDVGRSMCWNVMAGDCNGEKVTRPCKVYTLTEELSRDIELKRCPSCHHRKHCFIGPETRSLGLFNYNNSVLFTHELLEEYTSRYTSSETPFVSFVETIGRVYAGRGHRFVKEDLFRSAWFAYVNLQDYGDDMACARCGEDPDCLIWDGVTLAFGKKHLTSSLRPPTYTDSLSPKSRRSPAKKPQFLPEHKEEPIRRLMRNAIKKRQAKSKRRKEGDDESDAEEKPTISRTEYEILCRRLAVISKDLVLLLRRVFPPDSIAGEERMTRLYRTFFDQLAADEWAVQMVNWPAYEKLKQFAERVDRTSGTDLAGIPALYNVLEAEYRVLGRYPGDLVGVSQWMCRRVGEVFDQLTQRRRIDPLPVSSACEEDDWKK